MPDLKAERAHLSLQLLSRQYRDASRDRRGDQFGGQTCRRLRTTSGADDAWTGTKTALRHLARRIEHLDGEIAAIDAQLKTLVTKTAPQLLDEFGVGVVTAAQVITSWSHPGRCRNEAAFARLAGVAPIPASSGQTHRHRLTRGGDRRLNHALHMIAVTRARGHQETRDYIARRVAEGKTPREARRCIKHYLARRLPTPREPTHTTLDDIGASLSVKARISGPSEGGRPGVVSEVRGCLRDNARAFAA